MSRRAGLSRDAVVAAAVELTEAHGPDGLTLARLADRLGVRSPSLYKHVAGLDDVRAAVAAHAAEVLADALTAATIGRARDDAVARAAAAYRRLGLERPHLFAVLPLSHVGQAPAVVSASERALRVLFAVFEGYGLEHDDLVHVVRAFRSSVGGFVALEAAGGFRMDVDVERSFAFLVDTLVAGVAAPPGRSR